MAVEVLYPLDSVRVVLADLNVRRRVVGDIVMVDDDGVHVKALVRDEVPLIEILGYANSLRCVTGGEGAFTAEYKGHSHCDQTTK